MNKSKQNFVCKKLSKGKYKYKDWLLVNNGYYPPDKCVWWEAINIETNCADYHAHTKKDLIFLINNEK